jgi:hypothetical protein
MPDAVFDRGIFAELVVLRKMIIPHRACSLIAMVMVMSPSTLIIFAVASLRGNLARIQWILWRLLACCDIYAPLLIGVISPSNRSCWVLMHSKTCPWIPVLEIPSLVFWDMLIVQMFCSVVVALAKWLYMVLPLIQLVLG